MGKLTAPFAGLAMLTAWAPLPAMAEFLNPDWAELSIEGISEPDWIAGVRDGGYVGMCVACEGSMMLQVQVLRDDGTGGRVRSGATTAQTYTQLGKANAAVMGGNADYYSTEAIEFASAVGFRTQARGETGDYSATYQLWSDGRQLLVRVYGADRSEVVSLAARAFAAAAPLTFR